MNYDEPRKTQIAAATMHWACLVITVTLINLEALDHPAMHHGSWKTQVVATQLR
jgi:hypothetical protein